MYIRAWSRLPIAGSYGVRSSAFKKVHHHKTSLFVANRRKTELSEHAVHHFQPMVLEALGEPLVQRITGETLVVKYV